MGTRPWATQGPAGKLRSSISDMAFLWILGQSVSLLPRVLRKIWLPQLVLKHLPLVLKHLPLVNHYQSHSSNAGMCAKPVYP